MTSAQKNSSGLAVVVVALLCSMTTAMAQTQAQRHVKHPSLQEYYPYPPGSKAIDSSYWDYLHPWYVETQPGPMISEEAGRQIEALRRAGASSDEIARQLRSLLQSSPFVYQFEMN